MRIADLIQMIGSRLPQEVSVRADGASSGQGQGIAPSGEAGRQAMSELARG